VAFAHAGAYGSDDLIDQRGRPLPTGTLVIVAAVGTSTPASLFVDEDRSAPAANPVPLGATGNLRFFAEPGEYDLVVGSSRVTVVVAPWPADLDGAGPGGPVALDDLTDVDVPAPADGNVVAWDAAGSEWVARSLAQLGVAGSPLSAHSLSTAAQVTGVVGASSYTPGVSIVWPVAPAAGARFVVHDADGLVRSYVSDGSVTSPAESPQIMDGAATLSPSPLVRVLPRVTVLNDHIGGGGNVAYMAVDAGPSTAATPVRIGPMPLGGLTDVDVSSSPPGDGDALVWDAGAGEWVPGPAGGGAVDSVAGVAPVAGDVPDQGLRDGLGVVPVVRGPVAPAAPVDPETLWIRTAAGLRASHDWRAVDDGLLADVTPAGSPLPWEVATVGPGEVRLPVLDLSAFGPLPPVAENGALRGPSAPSVVGRVVAFPLDRPLSGVERFTVGLGDFVEGGTPEGGGLHNLTVVDATGTGPVLHVLAHDPGSGPVTRLKVGWDQIGAAFTGPTPVDLGRLLGAGDRVTLAIDTTNRRWWIEVNGALVAGTTAQLTADGANERVMVGAEEMDDGVTPLGPITPPDLTALNASSTPVNHDSGGWIGVGHWWAWHTSADVDLDAFTIHEWTGTAWTPVVAPAHPTSDLLGRHATKAQGELADTAVQPGDLGDAAGLDVGTGAGEVAAGDHQHSADDITSGTLPVVRGGLGLGALGSPGQRPTVNAAGTALEYQTPTAGGTVAPPIITAARVSGSDAYSDLVPIQHGGRNGTQVLAAGEGVIGWVVLPGVTLERLAVMVSATSLTAGQVVHVATYAPAADGGPGALDWYEAIDVGTSTGKRETTGLARAVDGATWVTVINPAGNAGSVTLRAGTPADGQPYSTTGVTVGSLPLLGSQPSTPTADLTALGVRSGTATATLLAGISGAGLMPWILTRTA